MSEDGFINIFTKAEELKFAPYWGKVEKYINHHSFCKNMGELLFDAMKEETTRLIWTLQHLMSAEEAEELVLSILDDAIDKVEDLPDLDNESLYKVIQERASKTIDIYFNADNKVAVTFIFGLIESFLKVFMKVKKGADMFCDLVFSDSIITESLEKDSSVSSLLYFIGVLGPNIFSEEYFNEDFESYSK